MTYPPCDIAILPVVVKHLNCLLCHQLPSVSPFFFGCPHSFSMASLFLPQISLFTFKVPSACVHMLCYNWVGDLVRIQLFKKLTQYFIAKLSEYFVAVTKQVFLMQGQNFVVEKNQVDNQVDIFVVTKN